MTEKPTDHGGERFVPTGYIEIAANASEGTIVVTELNSESARREVAGRTHCCMRVIATKDSGLVLDSRCR